MIKQDVLNAGYVRLVEYMGGDESVIRNARRCWRSENKSSEESDRNLIRHLLREGHMTPFETIVFTFDVKCPIFVARQWMRHRIGSFNEERFKVLCSGARLLHTIWFKPTAASVLENV